METCQFPPLGITEGPLRLLCFSGNRQVYGQIEWGAAEVGWRLILQCLTALSSNYIHDSKDLLTRWINQAVRLLVLV